MRKVRNFEVVAAANDSGFDVRCDICRLTARAEKVGMYVRLTCQGCKTQESWSLARYRRLCYKVSQDTPKQRVSELVKPMEGVAVKNKIQGTFELPKVEVTSSSMDLVETDPGSRVVAPKSASLKVTSPKWPFEENSREGGFDDSASGLVEDKFAKNFLKKHGVRH
jgi:hypothetical protein